MGAPSGIVWGSKVKDYGRIGIYKKITNTNTQTTLDVEIWIGTKYSVSDSNNTLYYDNRSSSGSASTSRGSVSVSTTVDSGSGWSSSNEKLLKSYSVTYDRGTSDATRYLYAKFEGIDRVGGTMYASTTATIPKLASYTISYNANGGSGAPGSQTKYYGKSLTLSSTKPTRTGYTFQGWALSKANADNGTWYYQPGNTCGKNENLTLYAVWKANTYTVTFNANGGTGAPGNQTKTYGVTLTLSSTKPTRANYTFLGWSTSATDTTATYSAGSSYTNNAATTLYAVWKLAYTKPVIANLTVGRYSYDSTTGKYSKSDEGTYARVYFNWSTFHDMSDTGSIVIKWASNSDSGMVTLDGLAGKTGLTQKYIDAGLDSDATYAITVTVSDSGGSTTATKTLPGTKYAMDLLAGGNGVAFGKAAELDGYADVGYELRLREGLYISGNKAFYGYDQNGTQVEFMNPINVSGNTVVGYGNYDRKAGNTNIYGYDVHIGMSSIATPGYYRPYRKRGDSVNFTLRTAGYVTNSGKDVTFTVPFSVPIVGSPTVTVTSISGFVLRQGTKYTHGSAAEVYVTPESYEASVSQWMGVTITAKFSNTTNVTNNDAIGIYWNGTITFS